MPVPDYSLNLNYNVCTNEKTKELMFYYYYLNN